MIYEILGIVYLLAIFITVGVWIYKTFFKKDMEVISKKNVVYLLPSFLIVYALYLTASFYNHETMDFYYCFDLIAQTADLFQYTSMQDLIVPISSEKWMYAVDFILASTLASATVILTLLSFFNKELRNWRRKRTVLKTEGDIVIGYSDTALQYLQSNKNTLLWDEAISAPVYSDLIKKGYAVCKEPFSCKKILKALGKREHHLIVFRDSDHSYGEMIKFFEEIKTERDNLLFLHLESSVEEMSVIEEKFVSKVNEKTNSFVSCFNQHELLARRFIMEYPITKYVPRSFYNDNFTLKDEKEINVVFIGFGRVNYELFKLMAMQFQFAKEDKETGRLACKPVNYYVFDNKEEKLHNECFSKILYEFDEIFKNSDFAKPEKICNLQQPELNDINSIETRKWMRALVNENSFTYFIVSLADDFADASYAQTLNRLFGEEDQYKIFVRTKNNDMDSLNGIDDSVIYFGGKNGTLTHDCIVNDDLMRLSQKIHAFYNDISSDRISLLRAWENIPLIEQYSNMYSALNLKFKLNMMGLDMVKPLKEEEKQIKEKDYLQSYNNPYAGKKIDKYAFFFQNNASNVIAFIEHSRWNAFYILYDYKPMKIKDFYWTQTDEGKRKLQHKNTEKKLHACLTSYEGLDKLIKEKYKIMYEKDCADENCDEFLSIANIYSYDYMVMDRAYDAVQTLNYHLVELKN